MPFKSKSQERWMFARHPEMAKRWAAETPDQKALPDHVVSDARAKQEVRPEGQPRKGRPAKVSKTLADQIAAAILEGIPEEQAAEQAGIDRATFFNWMKWGRSRPEFAEFYRTVTEAKARTKVSGAADKAVVEAKPTGH